mmetsp:Transcript_7723/g.11221  ORF Transcript_7723/g.11221 Transcript_7723/m.11221 type:complete len:422 (+) Transcript_7723:61-1326(+)
MFKIGMQRTTTRPTKCRGQLEKKLFSLVLCLVCVFFTVSIILMNRVETTLTIHQTHHHPWTHNSHNNDNANGLHNSSHHGSSNTMRKNELITTPVTSKQKQKEYSNDDKPWWLHDKDRLVAALESQNINISEISEQTWSQVPTWTQITELYGSKPIVIGLDQCSTFRDAVPENERIITPAGLFNTGTNLIASLLEFNCHFPNRRPPKKRLESNGVTWQTPWGKHSPPEFRNQTVDDPFFKTMNKDYVLPVVAIREPYEWMISTCHNNYVLRWPHRRRCPNLVHPNGTLIEVYNQYFHGDIRRYHKSLAHFWNDWNRQYTDPHPGFPRLMVRHKDLIFYPKETIQMVCECAGGELIHKNNNFTYIINAAKGNRKGAKPFDGLVGNWIKYGKEFDISQIPREDVEVAKNVLDETIMEMFDFKW